MATQERDFKGVWITKEVWLDARLNALEKVILTEIDSLDMGERGCWASNKHLADFCQCSETKVSTAISKLVKLGYIYVQKFDGRQRELKSRLSKIERQDHNFCEADLKNLQESNTENNTPNKTKREKKESNAPARVSYNSMIEEYTKDEELRDALKAFVQMRTASKGGKFTNRALELTFGKLDKMATTDAIKTEIVNQSVMHGWKGVFELKGQAIPTRSAGSWDGYDGCKLT